MIAKVIVGGVLISISVDRGEQTFKWLAHAFVYMYIHTYIYVCEYICIDIYKNIRMYKYQITSLNSNIHTHRLAQVLTSRIKIDKLLRSKFGPDEIIITGIYILVYLYVTYENR
jgi:hypothetical protein